MPRIVRSPLSKADYLDIWLYVAQDDPKAADRLVAEFDHHLETLACFPLIGRSEDDFAPALRSLPVGNYLLFYRPCDGGIELARVLHGGRNISAEFFGE